MRSAKPRCVVRVDPEIWTDQQFAESLTRDARGIWFGSLFYLAGVGEPAGIYPHVELVGEVGRDADRISMELTDFGIWSLAPLGYFVHEWSGCRVMREVRAAIPEAVRQAVYARDGYRCVTCGSGESLTLDHIVPWSLNGSDDESNLQTMCQPCNSRKGARLSAGASS